MAEAIYLHVITTYKRTHGPPKGTAYDYHPCMDPNTVKGVLDEFNDPALAPYVSQKLLQMGTAEGFSSSLVNIAMTSDRTTAQRALIVLRMHLSTHSQTQEDLDAVEMLILSVDKNYELYLPDIVRPLSAHFPLYWTSLLERKLSDERYLLAVSVLTKRLRIRSTEVLHSINAVSNTLAPVLIDCLAHPTDVALYSLKTLYNLVQHDLPQLVYDRLPVLEERMRNLLRFSNPRLVRAVIRLIDVLTFRYSEEFVCDVTEELIAIIDSGAESRVVKSALRLLQGIELPVGTLLSICASLDYPTELTCKEVADPFSSRDMRSVKDMLRGRFDIFRIANKYPLSVRLFIYTALVPPEKLQTENTSVLHGTRKSIDTESVFAHLRSRGLPTPQEFYDTVAESNDVWLLPLCCAYSSCLNSRVTEQLTTFYNNGFPAEGVLSKFVRREGAVIQEGLIETVLYALYNDSQQREHVQLLYVLMSRCPFLNKEEERCPVARVHSGNARLLLQRATETVVRCLEHVCIKVESLSYAKMVIACVSLVDFMSLENRILNCIERLLVSELDELQAYALQLASILITSTSHRGSYESLIVMEPELWKTQYLQGSLLLLFSSALRSGMRVSAQQVASLAVALEKDAPALSVQVACKYVQLCGYDDAFAPLFLLYGDDDVGAIRKVLFFCTCIVYANRFVVYQNGTYELFQKVCLALGNVQDRTVAAECAGRIMDRIGDAPELVARLLIESGSVHDGEYYDYLPGTVVKRYEDYVPRLKECVRRMPVEGLSDAQRQFLSRFLKS